MTTYRRFCCNDLLRIGLVNISAVTQTYTTVIYLEHIIEWPDNCIVANVPGGLIKGYIFGSIEGMGKKCTGSLSILNVASSDLARKLSDMLDYSCDMNYKAYTMKISIPTGNFEKRSVADKLGYILYDVEPEKFEMRKPLYRLLKTTLEEGRNEHERMDIIQILGLKDQLRS